jgi:hypothetical protein
MLGLQHLPAPISASGVYQEPQENMHAGYSDLGLSFSLPLKCCVSLGKASLSPIFFLICKIGVIAAPYPAELE